MVIGSIYFLIYLLLDFVNFCSNEILYFRLARMTRKLNYVKEQLAIATYEQKGDFSVPLILPKKIVVKKPRSRRGSHQNNWYVY